MAEDAAGSAAFLPSRVPEERPGQEGGKRHLNRIAKTRQLCEAGLAVFLERGLDATTIEDVVAAAEMSKGSFYRYFENKPDLVATLFQPLADTVRSAMEACAEALEEATDDATLEAAYAGLVSQLLELLHTQPDLIRLFLQERHGVASPSRQPVLDLDDEVLSNALRMTQAGQDSGMLETVDPRVSATMVLGGVHELLWRVFHGQGPDDPLAGALQLVDIVLHGVRRRG